MDGFRRVPAQPFPAVKAAVERTVKKVFPTAQDVKDFGMEGWRVTRPKRAPRPTLGGTMPSDFVFIFLADRKAGPTLHVWYPGHQGWLEARKAELEAAGFNVMRACLNFTRKQAYPIDSVERLLRDVKRMDDA